MRDDAKNFFPPFDRHSETCHMLVARERKKKKRFIEVNVYENHNGEEGEPFVSIRCLAQSTRYVVTFSTQARGSVLSAPGSHLTHTLFSESKTKFFAQTN